MVKLNKIGITKKSDPHSIISIEPTSIKDIIINHSKVIIKTKKEKVILDRDNINWIHWNQNIGLLELYFNGITYE